MNLTLTLMLMLFLASCRPSQDRAADKKAVETLLQNYFTAISKNDYQSLRDQCTDDYVLIEHGLWWNNDSLINVMKANEGQATIRYAFHDIKSSVEGSTAWMTYKNHGLLTMAKKKEIKLEWSESAVFKKQHGVWKMVLLHSTQTSPT